MSQLLAERQLINGGVVRVIGRTCNCDVDGVFEAVKA